MDTIQMMGAMDLSDLEATTDAALVVAIGRWRQEALAEAYRRHGGPVFALALRVLRQTALAEEVVQEIFVRLWYQPEKFDPMRGSLRSFLLANAHGRSIDLLRSENSSGKESTRKPTQCDTNTTSRRTSLTLRCPPKCARRWIL